MRGVIKIPIPLPQVPTLIFNYIININSNGIVITDSYGNIVATLNTISDLNNWLKGVKDKHIAVYSYIDVGDKIVLTRNKYMFARGRYSYIGLADTVELYFFGDYVDQLDNEPEGVYTDVSNSRIFIMNADTVRIYSPEEETMPLRNMTVTCIGCNFVFMGGFNGGVVVLSSVRENIILYSKLDMLMVDAWGSVMNNITINRTLYLRSTYASLNNVMFTGSSINIDASIPLSVTLKPSGQAGDTATIAVPLIAMTSNYKATVDIDVNVYIAQSGNPTNKINLNYLAPAGNSISYSVNPSNATITVKNNTTNNISVLILIRLLYSGVSLT